MGLGATLVTFTPNTTISATTVNANFTALNTVGTLSVPFATFSADNYLINSDGNGNLIWSGSIGQSTFSDLVTAGGSTTTFQLASGLGTFFCQSAGSNTFKISTVGIGNVGRVGLVAGAILRVSSFTGNATGTYSHNNGDPTKAPNSFALIDSVNANTRFSWDTATATTVHVNQANGNPFWCHVWAF